MRCLFGIEHGVVALTKADLADDDMRALRAAEIQMVLAKTRLADAPILPVSSVTGEGIAELKGLLSSFHTGRERASGYPAWPSTAASPCKAPALLLPARCSPAKSAWTTA